MHQRVSEFLMKTGKSLSILKIMCTVCLLDEGKEKELQEKEMKMMELQEMYETRLLQLKVRNVCFPTASC